MLIVFVVVCGHVRCRVRVMEEEEEELVVAEEEEEDV